MLSPPAPQTFGVLPKIRNPPKPQGTPKKMGDPPKWGQTLTNECWSCSDLHPAPSHGGTDPPKKTFGVPPPQLTEDPPKKQRGSPKKEGGAQKWGQTLTNTRWGCPKSHPGAAVPFPVPSRPWGGVPWVLAPPSRVMGVSSSPPRTLVAVGDVVTGLGVEEEGGQAERLVALVAQADIVVA